MIEVGQTWRSKGKGKRYEVRVLKVGRNRITLERIKGGPVGGQFRVHHGYLTAAYDLVPPGR